MRYQKQYHKFGYMLFDTVLNNKLPNDIYDVLKRAKMYSNNKEEKNLQVSLIGKKNIYKVNLPRVPIGNYWISDRTGKEEKKIIEIEGNGVIWQATSNSYAKIVSLDNIEIMPKNIRTNEKTLSVINKVQLMENQMYAVILGYQKEIFILYCSEVYEKRLLHLDIGNTQEITIGKERNNHIIYDNDLILNLHARITRINGKWAIKNYDTRFPIFVNNIPVYKETRFLYNGDIIFIMGLKIIIMKNSIYINQIRNYITYKEKYFSWSKVKNSELNAQSKKQVENEDEEVELYKDSDYYSRAPRITNLIEKEKVKIDPPPHIQDKQETPLLLVLGSSLSMGVIMVISIVTAVQGRASGTATTGETTIALITAFAMLIAMLVIPFVNVKYDRKQKVKYEEKRQKKYKQYLNSKSASINKVINKQKNILYKNYLSAEECTKIILDKSPRLWERKIEDYDFLSIRVGIGDVPLDIDIQYPEEHFDMDDDELVDILNDIGEKSKIIKDAPVVTSLTEKNVSAIISKDDDLIEKFLQNIIIQLVTFHSYEDLKLVFMLKKDNLKKWEFIKMLPHVWDETKQIRFFADNHSDMQAISRYLEEVLKNREKYNTEDYKSFTPYYLIITDDYKEIENLRFTMELLKKNTNMGFSLLCITKDLFQLPNECKTFISLENAEAMIFDSEISIAGQKIARLELQSKFFIERLCQIISNIPIRYKKAGSQALPNNLTFLEMYNVGRIEQLNVLERWKRNDPTLSLDAPIGVDITGNIITLDIHEKYHGPHGLIAGSTGSGKSEFIITYILSLAINFHPDDVAFLLIDYKGGGLAGAFKKNNIKLPHLIGTITNIDINGLQRSLTSIQSELRRRQIIFNEARDLTDEGTIDIYKYQKLYHDGIVKEPIPHLLIICDEFAELKQQQEDFMDELMSVSRIGRSLGVHLILATQKPAGIVNDQIRSNSKFAICLRVQDSQDSYDVIKKPDAADLKNAGQFYMQVGNDEYFILGQSGWAGAQYFPTDVIKKRVDNSIEFISNIGVTIKRVDDTIQQVKNSRGEQLTNIVKYIYSLAKAENIKTNNLWLDVIPENIYVKDLRRKYNVKVDDKKLEVVFGEYDDPSNQKQGVVKINLFNKENIIIYGNAESGKETLLSTMIYDLMTTYTTSQVQMYILDFGSEALKIFRNSPHIGDVVFNGDDEKISRFFDMLQREIQKRKSILSNYNGDYNLYIKSSKDTMPIIVVMINGYEAFSESYNDKYDDLLLKLTRESLKCGIIFITTASAYNNMRYRLTQNFGRKIALQLNNEDEYLNIFDNVGRKRPSRIFGRGLINIIGKEIFEFQTAKICEHVDYNLHIEEMIKQLNEVNKLKAKHIPTIPERIDLNDVSEYLTDITHIPIGMTRKELNIYTYDFTKRLITIIVSKNMDNAIEFLSYILEEIKRLEGINIDILDAESVIRNKKESVKEAYDRFFYNIIHSETKTLGVIIGIDKILSNSEIDEFQFGEILKKVEESEKGNIIIIENPTRLKNHEYNDWYKNFVNSECGIWVGKGIEDQFLISISSERRSLVNNCGNSYGYIIEEGNAIMLKLIGMKENSDKYE